MNVKFFISGKETNPPTEWRDIEITCAWTNNVVVPNIVGSDFEFSGDSGALILDHIAGGLTTGGGIFEGLPFTMVAEDEVDGSQVVFEGMLDFLEGFEVIHPDIVKVRISKPEDIDLMDKRLQGLTYGFLWDNGLIPQSMVTSVAYVVEPTDKAAQEAMIAISIAIATVQGLSIVRQYADDGFKLTGVFTTPYGIAVFVIDVIYAAIVIIALVKLISELRRLLSPPPRKQLCLSPESLLTVAFSHLGFEFVNTMPELADLKFIPSRLPEESNNKRQRLQDNTPIPQAQDYGYRCSEMLELILDLFNAQVQIIGNKVLIKPEGDPFWRQNAKYKLPDVLLEQYTYNIEEAYFTQLFSFATDLSDKHTIADFRGTNVQVNLESTQKVERKFNLLKGYREVRWNVARGSEILKSKKGIGQAMEFLGMQLSQAFQKITKIKSNIKTVRSRNYLMVDSKNWSVAKLVVARQGLITNDNSTFLTALNLYEKYHKHRSFTGDFGQKKRYKDILIPFGLRDYLDVLNSAYFTTDSGQLGKFEKLDWRLGKDHATVTFVIYEKYITTLKETLIEG